MVKDEKCGQRTAKGGSKMVPTQSQLDCPYRIKQTLGKNQFSNYSRCCRNSQSLSDHSSISEHQRHRDSMLTTSSIWQDSKNGFCGPLSWSFFPIAICLTTSVGFIVTYTLAKTNCHIERWIFPYLSYTGTEHPESMLFGLILNIEGFFGLIVVFLAWRFYRHMGQRGCLNSFALIFGCFSCLGVIMVGNFQVTKAKIPHYIGAGLAFIIGTGYGVLSSILSCRSYKVAQPPMKYATCVSAMRCACAVIMVCALTLLSGVGMYKKLSERNKTVVVDYSNMTLMLPNGSCVELLSKIPFHIRYVDLLGSSTEWLLTACLIICLSLFTYEFRAFANVKVLLLTQTGPLSFNNNNCGKYPRNARKSLHSEVALIDPEAGIRTVQSQRLEGISPRISENDTLLLKGSIEHQHIVECSRSDFTEDQTHTSVVVTS